MPIYEYSCRKCEARVEVMQKITDKPLKRCGSCGGKLEKEWSTSSFQLKGAGWYVTDYAAKKTGAPDAEPTKETGAAETETVAATKTEGEAAKTEPAAVATAAKEETKGKKTSRPAPTSKPAKSD